MGAWPGTLSGWTIFVRLKQPEAFKKQNTTFQVCTPHMGV